MPCSRISVHDVLNAKKGRPLVCLTAYTTPMARILDRYTDVILVGDSVGMVLYGMDSTLCVSLEMMVQHGAAVMRGAKQAFVVVDMPYGSYQVSKELACANAMRLIQETGCQAVKLEGGAHMAETVAYVTERGIPVIGHLGLMPQHVNAMGGYRYQGKSDEQAKQIIADAFALQEAGVTAIVLEGVPSSLAHIITEELTIPTIGIGASAHCDGQILVTEDMLGLFPDATPRFVKQYGMIATDIDTMISRYAQDVRERIFPGKEHSYPVEVVEKESYYA